MRWCLRSDFPQACCFSIPFEHRLLTDTLVRSSTCCLSFSSQCWGDKWGCFATLSPEVAWANQTQGSVAPLTPSRVVCIWVIALVQLQVATVNLPSLGKTTLKCNKNENIKNNNIQVRMSSKWKRTWKCQEMIFKHNRHELVISFVILKLSADRQTPRLTY